MNLNAWTWIGGVIGFVGFVAAIQQFLEHGWKKFIRAVVVALLSLLPLVAIAGLRIVSTEGPPDSETAGVPMAETPSPGNSVLVPTPNMTPVPTLKPSGPTPEIAIPNHSSDARKDQLPTQLSPQQRFFRPEQVMFCPSCGKAYASLGPKEQVECLQCRKVVNLVSRSNVAVWRCRNCGGLATLTYTGHETRVSCPICNRIQFVP